MSNFFAALDSDDEGTAPAPAVTKKKAPKKEVVEPSKVEKRPLKGDRNTKGGRSSRPPARDGKRTFDRKSGTGRGKELKKGGGGGHNWGSDQNDAKKAEGPVTEGNEEANTPEGEDLGGEEEKEKTEKEPEPEPEPEPEEKTISYEEYLATKERPDSVAFAAVAEREVENEFAGKAARPSGREEEEAFIMKGGKKQPKKKGGGRKEKESLVLDFKVKNSLGDGRRDSGRRDSGGRDSGGRGGGRGGGGRGDGRRDRGGRSGGGGGRGGESGGGRGGGGSNKGLDTTDSNAFPSL